MTRSICSGISAAFILMIAALLPSHARADCARDCDAMCQSGAGDTEHGCLTLCQRSCDQVRVAETCTPEGYACIINGTPCCDGGTCDGTFPNTFCSGSGETQAGDSPDGAACYEDEECSGESCEGGSCCTASNNPCDDTSHCCGYQACGANGYCP